MFLRLMTLAFFITFMPSEKAIACSCIKGGVDNAIKVTPIIAMAEVIEHLDSDKVLLRFGEVWKGKVPLEKKAVIEVGTRSDCSPDKIIQPVIGTKYLLYIYYGIDQNQFQRVRLRGCTRSGTPQPEDIRKLNEYKNTLNEFDKIIVRIWDYKGTRIKKASFLVKYRDYTNAYDIYEDLIQNYPEDSKILSGFSELLYRIGKNVRIFGNEKQKLQRTEEQKKYYDRALKYAVKALSIDNGDTVANSYRIRTLAALGKNIDEDLDNANLSSIKISRQTFEGKSAKNTKFKSAKFNNVTFKNMVFNNADFSSFSRLQNTKFISTKILNCNFDRARMLNSTIQGNKGRIVLNKSGFENSTIEKSSFINAKIGGLIIDTKINNSDFNGMTLHGGWDDHFVFIDNVIVNNTDFSNAKLVRNTLKNGEIINSKFIKSNFKNATIAADIINTDFSQSNLDNVSLIGSRFDCKSKWPEGFDPTQYGAVPLTFDCGTIQYSLPSFEGASAVEARLWSMDLDGANFRKAKFHGARFDKTNLKKANFFKANMSHSRFYKSGLNGSDFTSAVLTRTNFSMASLVGANLSNSYMYFTEFSGADLRGASLTGAKIQFPLFKGALYNSKTQWPEGFDYQSSGAVFKE